MPFTRREFLGRSVELAVGLGAAYAIGGCASAPARGPISKAVPTPIKKDALPVQVVEAAPAFRLTEDTGLLNPETAIEQITATDEIIAKHYPELSGTQPKDAVRIQTPNNNLYIFNFTGYDFDPVAALQTYAFYERFASSGYSGTYSTLDKQKVPFKIMPPGKANILVFIIPESAPDAEWILSQGGADKPAGTVLYEKEGLNLTRIRVAMPKGGSASVDAQVAGSKDKFTDLNLLIEAGQSVINAQTQAGREASNRVADSFINQLARALYNRRLGKSYTEYAGNRKPGTTGIVVDKNIIFPADTIGEAIYNQLPVIPPVIKQATSGTVYSNQK
ncbi:MAG: hypothetical protein M1450_02020 [Patescibacteria group bacterium]|nr:hypothetical protein [Patescibacteria group bacterium]